MAAGRPHPPLSRTRVIEQYAVTGRIDLACELAGVERSCHYAWMKKYPEYAASILATRTGPALQLLLDKAAERALAGTSDRLLEFLIKGLDPVTFGDKMKSELSGPDGGPVQIQAIEVNLVRARDGRREIEGGEE